jgi:hypothetical protein
MSVSFLAVAGVASGRGNIRVQMKAPWTDPSLRELLALAALAAFGCGLALAQGDLLFLNIFGALRSDDHRGGSTFALRSWAIAIMELFACLAHVRRDALLITGASLRT